MNHDPNVNPSSAPYARNLFPKMVENKEFPHSYKKNRLPTSIGYRPDTLGQERMAF